MVKPGDADYDEVYRRIRSSEDLVYRSTPAPSRPNKLHRPRPSLENRKPMKPIPLVLPPRPPLETDQGRPRAKTESPKVKTKEKAVPVPFPMRQDASTLPSRRPPGSRAPIFTPFATTSREASSARSTPASPPPVSSAPAISSTRAFLAHPLSKTHQLERSVSLTRPAKKETRESVYCSTGPATVQRHGAIRKTSSSGDANLPPQHARYRPERTAEKEARRAQADVKPSQTSTSIRSANPSAAHVPRSQPAAIPQASSSSPSNATQASSKPAVLRRETPVVKPKPRGVPHDVSADPSSESEYTETPRSSLMLFPPAPVASSSMVAKVQANMHVKESSAPRVVQLSAGDLSRATSHKAHIEGTPMKSRGDKVKRTVEVFGMEIFELERAQAVQEEQLARGAPAAPLLGGKDAALPQTRPLAVRKGKGKEGEGKERMR